MRDREYPQMFTEKSFRASMENVVGSDYAGSHWLATFLMYALETRAATVASL